MENMVLSFFLVMSTLTVVLGGEVGCLESIFVYEIELSAGGAMLEEDPKDTDFSTLTGDYLFRGFKTVDSKLYPVYLHESGAYISVGINILSGIPFEAVSLTIPDFTYEGNSFGDTTWWGAPSTFGEIIDSDEECPLNWIINDEQFNYNPGAPGAPGAEDNYDWFFTNYYPIRMKAVMDDCPDYGFSYGTIPISPCGDYKDEVDYCDGTDGSGYDGCAGDRCRNGQCDAVCNNGYFKMEWNHECQSCDIIPNCVECNSYYGCTKCENGRPPVWDHTCGPWGRSVCGQSY